MEVSEIPGRACLRAACQTRTVRIAVLLLTSLLSAPVCAQDSPASSAPPTPPPPGDVAELARRAAETHEEGCRDSQLADASAAGQAIAAVSALLPEVDAALKASDDLVLLYWRGMLQMCIGRAEFAADDFSGFLRGASRAPELRGMVEDAQRRLKRLGGGTSRRTPAPGPAFLIAGAAIGGTFGGLAGWQADVLATARDEYVHPWLQDERSRAQLVNAGTRAARNANVFIGLAAGVGGALEIVGVAATASKGRKAGALRVGAWPASGGAVFALGADW